MNYYLSLAALVPVVLLFIRVYRLDRIEKEPRVLLGKLIGLGALAAVPAALVEVGLLHLLGRAAPRASAAYLLVQNFLIVAGSEELGKFLPVRLAAWRDPAFDYRFDAVVYAVSSSLGFAAVENVLYVMQSDLRTAVSRAILSVPGHFFFAVCMGLFLSRAKQAESCGQLRRRRRWRCTGSGTSVLRWPHRGQPRSFTCLSPCFSSLRTITCARRPRRMESFERRGRDCIFRDAFSGLPNETWPDCVAVRLFCVYNI